MGGKEDNRRGPDGAKTGEAFPPQAVLSFTQRPRETKPQTGALVLKLFEAFTHRDVFRQQPEKEKKKRRKFWSLIRGGGFIFEAMERCHDCGDGGMLLCSPCT